MSAPYSVSFSLTDDTTFGWEAALSVSGGADFPWAGVRATYTIRDDCGGLVTAISSDADGGLTIDAATNRILCLLPGLRLTPGFYRHGLRLVSPDGIYLQVFDGTFTITEGNF